MDGQNARVGEAASGQVKGADAVKGSSLIKALQSTRRVEGTRSPISCSTTVYLLMEGCQDLESTQEGVGPVVRRREGLFDRPWRDPPQKIQDASCLVVGT